MDKSVLELVGWIAFANIATAIVMLITDAEFHHLYHSSLLMVILFVAIKAKNKQE